MSDLEKETNETWEKIKTHRNRFKIKFDSYHDPFWFWTTSNVGLLIALNEGLDAVSVNVQNNEGLAMMGTYAGGIAALYAVNKWGINKFAHAFHNVHKDRAKDRKKENTLGGFFKTAAQWGVTAAMAAGLNLGTAIDNFRYDAGRVVNAFARPGIERVVETEPEAVVETESTPLPVEEFPVNPNGGPQITGSLTGRSIGGYLGPAYTGIRGVVPDTVSIDFEERIDTLWKQKQTNAEAIAERTGGVASPVIQEIRDEMVAFYNVDEATKMTLTDYIAEADHIIREVNRTLDWEKVRELEGLSGPEGDLVRVISENLSGRDLVAYSMTEIMDGRDGILNAAIYDFLLRNAGREYVEAIPALGDYKASFGPYQFTEFAVFDLPDEKRGASQINLALPESVRIPGSVKFLRGNDHHKAAYLFAIDNIAELVDGLSRAQFDVLSRSWESNLDDIIKYIATAHHGPAPARSAARRWLDNGARSDYTVSTNGRFVEYSRKTDANFRALHP